ncbi:uncharacterized protein LOC124488270 isoform X5 [Hypomesus transpacificus]|uniref:uncharacterized protein LOC124488270 isoform X5 n=1 Tax=Hypomesus transpacificus TaxID=137520 RepID=UPI001F07E48F|nr:uncharacterized protein LOC124488270 isoform X5 [Hypomesus transpacificus]
MMSRNVFKDVIYRFKNFTPQISLTSGIVTVIIVCCALFIVTSHFSLAQDVFSLGTSAFVNGHDGKGWFSMLDMSEARASILDKKMPFRLLRNIGVLYVPASVEEKKKVVHPRITPIPGSYPVQAYAPVSTLSSLQATEATPKMYEGWPHSSYTQASPIPHSAPHGHSHGYGLAYNFGFNNGHSYEHSHGHGCSHNHSQAHGHCHKHVFLDRNSHGGNDSCSQHSHVSPMNMHSGQPVGYLPHPDTFSRFPESDLGPTSVMIDPVAPVGFSG